MNLSFYSKQIRLNIQIHKFEKEFRSSVSHVGSFNPRLEFGWLLAQP
jgi:hypothetical protein